MDSAFTPIRSGYERSDAEAGSRNIAQSGWSCRNDDGSMFVTGPSRAPFTASALRSSGHVQTMERDHRICLSSC